MSTWLLTVFPTNTVFGSPIDKFQKERKNESVRRDGAKPFLTAACTQKGVPAPLLPRPACTAPALLGSPLREVEALYLTPNAALLLHPSGQLLLLDRPLADRLAIASAPYVLCD